MVVINSNVHWWCLIVYALNRFIGDQQAHLSALSELLYLCGLKLSICHGDRYYLIITEVKLKLFK